MPFLRRAFGLGPESQRLTVSVNSYGATEGQNPRVGNTASCAQAATTTEAFYFGDCLLQNICRIIVSAIILTVACLLIVAGCLHANHCPAEPRIPFWMLVTGVMAMAQVILQFAVTLFLQSRDEAEIITRVFSLVPHLIWIAWLITGTVWVYRTSPSFDPQSKLYCDRTIYIASEVTIAVFALFLAVLLRRSCCYAISGNRSFG